MNVLSNRERDILKILGRRKMGLTMIAFELFNKVDKPPFDPEITINNSVKRIIKKCKHHKLDWSLERTKVKGKLIIRKITI